VFILEEPYVSDLLKGAARDLGAPVLDTPMARQALSGSGLRLWEDAAFAEAFSSGGHPRIYANSEHAIGWVARHLGATGLPERISRFKDKIRFREMLADLYPDYRFTGLDLEGLARFDPHSIRAPFVVKPAVGFFSLGVRVVRDPSTWPDVVEALKEAARRQGSLYPGQVVDFGRFIVEEVIEGEEFAVDAYYDGAGRVVVLDVLGHLFASEEDVSDRVYYTSPGLITRWREPFAAFLEEVGRRAGLRDFPVHAELRVGADGRITPIEVNPMRFAGWCVADMAHHAYGLNPYACFLEGRVPDWERILPEREGKVFALVVADLPPQVDPAAIESVDYEAFLARFHGVLELRKVDFTRHPVFAFLFLELPEEELPSLRGILGEDLSRYACLREPVPEHSGKGLEKS
jgi:hypothetical protein